MRDGERDKPRDGRGHAGQPGLRQAREEPNRSYMREMWQARRESGEQAAGQLAAAGIAAPGGRGRSLKETNKLQG